MCNHSSLRRRAAPEHEMDRQGHYHAVRKHVFHRFMPQIPVLRFTHQSNHERRLPRAIAESLLPSAVDRWQGPHVALSVDPLSLIIVQILRFQSNMPTYSTITL